MESICGANCEECELLKSKKCDGCKNTKGCLFGKKCWIAKYIELGDDNYTLMKKSIIDEFNSLKIDGLPKVEELYPLIGSYINMEYTLPNGKKVKLLKDDESYLGTQLECEFNNDIVKKCFGLVANMNYILVCEYEENGNNPEIIIYKKR